MNAKEMGENAAELCAPDGGTTAGSWPPGSAHWALLPRASPQPHLTPTSLFGWYKSRIPSSWMLAQVEDPSGCSKSGPSQPPEVPSHPNGLGKGSWTHNQISRLFPQNGSPLLLLGNVNISRGLNFKVKCSFWNQFKYNSPARLVLETLTNNSDKRETSWKLSPVVWPQSLNKGVLTGNPTWPPSYRHSSLQQNSRFETRYICLRM